MRHTDAEIKRVAREMSDGCSKSYNILLDKLKEARDVYETNVSSPPRSDDPGGGPSEPERSVDQDVQPEDEMIYYVSHPDPGPPIPEVIWVRRMFFWSFTILAVLIFALVVWSSFVEVPQ